MNTLSLLLSEFIGLFIDDEFLAVAILAVVVVAAGMTFLLQVPSLFVGAVLLIGCVVVLLASVYRGATKR
ncbi:hypothetical protein ABIB57_005383 [Devosia sp. UYZn731]|uniref:hypothetical protein n=1 Tax=Devosia sp. UYZn731 TaxID=3156345 RepID=UPI00339246A7